MRRLGQGGGIKGRIKGIEIAAVQLFLRDAEKFAESLVMDQLTFPKKTNRLAYIVIPDNTKNVVVGRTGLLFCCQVLVKVCNHISFGLELTGIERNAASGLRPDAGSVVNIVGAEALVCQLLSA